jgi:hypothetical protein
METTSTARLLSHSNASSRLRHMERLCLFFCCLWILALATHGVSLPELTRTIKMKTALRASHFSRGLIRHIFLSLLVVIFLNLSGARSSLIASNRGSAENRQVSTGGQVNGDLNVGSATATQDPTPEKFTVEPSQVSRGSSHQLIIKSNICAVNRFEDRDKVINDLPSLKDKHGLDISNPQLQENDCTYTADLAVMDTAAFGDVIITLHYKENDSDQTATFKISVVKEEPLPPGPLPPGLKPQVDIMWGVVPQRIVKDNFGTRVGKLFYCIEVVIGNNTGYDLQIASVGFDLGPVGDAAASVKDTINTAVNDAGTRHVVAEAAAAEAQAIRDEAQAKQDESIAAISRSNCERLSSRNGRRNDRQRDICSDAGLADQRTAVSRETARQSRDVAQIKRQLADNAIKSQVDTVKDEASRMAALSQVAYAQKFPASSYMITRGSIAHGQIWSSRNIVINSLKAFGPFLTGFTPFFHDLNHRGNFSEGVNIFSNPLEKGIEAVIPDETIAQLQRLDEEILRDGMIIRNNRQIRTRVFVPKDVLRLKKDLDGKDMRDDPMMVTLALGRMSLIGNTIAYINRVSVTSGGSGEVKPPPTVNPKATETILQHSSVTITFTGTSLEQASISSDSPDTIQVSEVTSTATSVSAKITVTNQALPGPHNLTVATARPPAVTIPIVVERPQPTIESTEARVSLSEGNPIKASLTEDLPYKITVHGTYLQGATLKPLANDDDRALEVGTQPDASQSDGTSFTATIILPKGTPAGTYEFEVRNDRPINVDHPAKFEVEVKGQDAPDVELEGPDPHMMLKDNNDKTPVANPVRSQDVTIGITGANLNGAELVVPPGSNATGKLEVVAPDKANTNSHKLVTIIKVKKEATPANGQPVDYELRVESETGGADFKFRLSPQPAPTVTSPTDPLTAKTGQTISVVITGTNLEGGNITLPTDWHLNTGPTPNSDGTQLTADIVIPANAVPSGDTEKIYTLEIRNSNTAATPKTFRIKVTP